jgi:uncharacterized membrane protein YcaP (DUF421 family)
MDSELLPVAHVPRPPTSGATEEEIMSVDWTSVFQPTIGLFEIVVRGTIMYLGLFAILRLVSRRQAGSFGPADLLVIVLIADAAQNALGKDYGSVTEGITLVLTIVAWEYILDWAKYRFPQLRNLLVAPSLTLIEDGKINHQNMRREMLSEEDLRSQLREKEVLTYKEVKLAKLEGDGRLSVIKVSP